VNCTIKAYLEENKRRRVKKENKREKKAGEKEGQ
jgi:hypothetical protein